jgi:tetratricopeptide (TPR) repeat protein
MTNKPCWTVKNIFLLLFLAVIFSFQSVNNTIAAPPPVKFLPAAMITPTFTPQDNSCELILKSHAPLTKYSSFFLDSPNRLVIDISNADFQSEYKVITTSCQDINEIRIARHNDKVRIVFDLTAARDIQHHIKQNEEGLIITVEKKGPTRTKKTEKTPEVLEKELNPAPKTITPIVKPITQNAATEALTPIPDLNTDKLLIQAQKEFALQRYDSVIDISTRVIVSDSNNAEAYSNRCGARAMKHLYSEAYNDCIKAIDLAPRAPMGYNNLGWVVEQQGNIDEALSHYNKSCELKNSLGCRNYNRLQTEITPAPVIPSPEKIKAVEAVEAVEAKTPLSAESSESPEEILSTEDSSAEKNDTPKTTKQLIATYFPAKKITLSLFKSDIQNFFSQIEKTSGQKILVDPSANAPLSLNLQGTHLPEAIHSILTIYDLRIEKRENYFFVFRKKAN